jgi:hypothetical protein
VPKNRKEIVAQNEVITVYTDKEAVVEEIQSIDTITTEDLVFIRFREPRSILEAMKHFKE